MEDATPQVADSTQSGGWMCRAMAKRMGTMMEGHVLEWTAAAGISAEHLARTLAVVVGGSWIALLFHELGHAFAATALGVRIWGIRLGAGPTLWRGRVGECRLHL